MATRARVDARRLRAVAVAAAVVLVAVGLLVVPAAVLMAAPTLALTVALVAGWMPGEATIARWQSRRASTRSRHGFACAGAAHTSPARARGRIVICFALANRPPPLRALATYLTYLELFVIDAICQWCVASAVLLTLLAVLTAWRLVLLD